MKRLLFCALACTLGGCSARYTVLTVPAVSMTEPAFDASYKGTPSGRVNVSYCKGDSAIASHDRNVGMMDEAILKAQNQSGARYLTDVTLSRDGSCLVVEATAMK